MRQALILLLIFSLFGCGREPIAKQIQQAAGDLDRKFVPVLVFTDLHKQRESELAMARFWREWHKFYAKFGRLKLTYGLDISDPDWPTDFQAMDALIASAEGLVKAERLTDANIKLLAFRFALKDVFQRHGWDSFLGHLLSFDRVVSEAVAGLRGRKEISDLERTRLNKKIEAARSSLLAAEKIALPQPIFGFTGKKARLVKNRVRQEQKLLAAFSDSLQGTRTSEMRLAADALKPNFDQLIKAFGDFEPIFTEAKKLKGGKP